MPIPIPASDNRHATAIHPPTNRNPMIEHGNSHARDPAWPLATRSMLAAILVTTTQFNSIHPPLIRRLAAISARATSATNVATVSTSKLRTMNGRSKMPFMVFHSGCGRSC